MPEPTPTQWADAHRYCSLDPHFQSMANHREAVKQYVKAVNMLDDNEKDEINGEVIDSAAKWERIRKPYERVAGFKGLLRERLPLMGKSACLSHISGKKEFNDALHALLATLDRVTFEVRRDTTQNAGGTVTLSVSILEDPKQDAEEAVLFALAHEFGHSADLTLNPYNVSDTSYPAFHQAVMPSLPSSTSKNQRLEYFADAFATVFLVSGAGIGKQKIPPAANYLFAAERGGGDHPSGEARLIKIKESLESKC